MSHTLNWCPIVLMALAMLLCPACSGGRVVEGGLFLDAQVQVNQGPAFGKGRDPNVCCAGGVFYVVWEDDRNGNDDIYFNRSADGGLTWLPSDVRVNANGAGVSDSDNPRICCSGQTVYVVWDDKRRGDQDIYVNYSPDGGSTWQPSDIRLDREFGDFHSNKQRICCDGANVYVTWTERQPEGSHVFINASFDGGATWFAEEVRVDEGLGGNAEEAQVCCSGSTVYVAWRTEASDTSIIYATVSTDGGQSFPECEVPLSSPGTRVDPPQMCCDGPNVYVVWDSDREEDIFLNSSLDGGLTWQPEERRLNTDPIGTDSSENVQICCDGLNVYVAWQDARTRDSGIYLNRSADGGLSWEANDIRIDHHPEESRNCGICCEGDSVYVGWTDSRNGVEEDVFFNYSLDGGLTWQATDYRVDTDAADQNDPNRPRLCCDAGTVYVLWYLDEPTSHIYLNRATP